MTRIGITAPTAPYIAAVVRAGAEAVPIDVASAPMQVLRDLDGLVLSGGVDIDPARYGGRTEHARSQASEYRRDRDDLEIACAREVRERGLPVLCICRGLQVANVAFGGTLVEDIEEDFALRGIDPSIRHQQMDEAGNERSDYADRHDVALERESTIASIVGTLSLPTNSMHHQAIRSLGDGLRVTGRASDGVIEAVEATFAHPFFVAVQWHPEELDDAPNNALFGALVRAAQSS